jgi:ABC-type dipeptide/oligopeptide/nickel transport system permease component
VKRRLRATLLALLLPGVLFCAVAGSRRGLCLQGYAWEPGTGYRPVPSDCAPDENSRVPEAALFYGRAVSGFAAGRWGRSREDASRPLLPMLAGRAARSLLVLGVGALGVLLLGAASALFRRRGSVLVPAGLPLPIAGLLVFVAVVRLLPPGSPFDYDRAGLLWAGLALALADGVGALFLLGRRQVMEEELAQPYADALTMLGRDPRPAARWVARRVSAAQLRGAILGLVGGLLVVEGMFGVNGLGETLRDLVVDRRGVDPLMLLSVLLFFSGLVLGVELLPVERLVARGGA